MIIYNKTWLDNLMLHQRLADEQHAGCITGDEVKAVKAKYPVGFYMPGVFGRIGLGLLTFIITQFSAGLLTLFFATLISTTGAFVFPLIIGIACYAALEFMTKQNHYFRSGIDDVLLWMSGGFTTGAFIWMMSTFHPTLNTVFFVMISVFICLLALYFVLRFSDALMSVVCCASCLSIVFFAWKGVGAFGTATLPFIMMIAAAVVYIIATRLANKPEAKYYTYCTDAAQLVGLIVLYLAGNYFIVQKLGSQLNHLPDNAPIPFGFIFWGWTVLLPLAYILRGILKKDVILLRLGLLLVAAAIFTFRYYYHILSAEAALTLGGIIILTLTYSIIRYLKAPRYGFTYADINKANMMDKLNIESLIIAQTAAHATVAPAKAESRFGGGNFGGGGSSSTF